MPITEPGSPSPTLPPSLQTAVMKQFFRHAVPPMILSVTILLALYFSVAAYSHWVASEALLRSIENQMGQLTRNDARFLNEQMRSLQERMRLLQREWQAFYADPTMYSPPTPLPSYGIHPQTGYYMKLADDGGAMAGVMRTRSISDGEKDWILRSERLDLAMQAVLASDPDLTAIYYLARNEFFRLLPFVVPPSNAEQGDTEMESVIGFRVTTPLRNPSRDPVWTGVYLDRLGNGWMSTCAVPVDHEGVQVGVLGLDLRIRRFAALFNALPENMEGMLIDGNDNVILGTDQLETRLGIAKQRMALRPSPFGTPFSFPPEFNVRHHPQAQVAAVMQRILDQRSNAEGEILWGRVYLSQVAHIPTCNWRLVILGDREAMLQPVLVLRRQTWQAGAAAIALCVILAFFIVQWLRSRSRRFAGNLTGPIEALDLLVQYMRDTPEEERRAAKLPRAGIEELDRLTANFAEMRTELDRYRNHLQDLVNLRTCELRETNVRLEKTIEELTEAQEALIRAERFAAVGTLAAGVAHEFNNVHQVITGWAETVLSYQGVDEFGRDGLERILNASRRGGTIARNLLSFASGATRKMEPVRLDELGREVLDMLSRDLEQDGVHVETDWQDVPPSVMDSAQISQVIMNLVINDRHAMHGCATRELTLSTGQEGEQLFLRVGDTGCGMDEKARYQVFAPFFSTKGEHAQSDSRQRELKGTGLGLSISQRIVENHGGRIDVTSEPGTGSTFTIWLPLRAVSDTNEPGYANLEILCGARILVIEDEDEVRGILMGALESSGAHGTFVSSGEEALARFDKVAPEVMLLDLQMPGMDGFTLLKCLRERGGFMPPVIVLTGKLLGSADIALLEQYGCRILAKPCSLQRLLDTLAAALNQFRAES